MPNIRTSRADKRRPALAPMAIGFRHDLPQACLAVASRRYSIANVHVTAGRVSTNPSSAAYFSKAEPYLRRNYRIEARSELVRDLIGRPSGARILDLGCGNGAISLQYAASNSVILVDNSAAMLDAAGRKATELGVAYSALQADACDVEVEPVDIVLAIGILAHVAESEGLIAAAARNLKSGGRLVLQFSDAGLPLNRLGSVLFRLRGRRYRRTPRAEILEIAEANALRLVGERSHLLVVPGMPRLIGRLLLPYDRLVRRLPWLARHGLDTLLLLQKQ